MNALSCPRREQTSSWLAQGLPGPDAERLAEHVRQCASCARDPQVQHLLARTLSQGALSTHSGQGTPLGGAPGLPGGGRLREYELQEKLGQGGMGAVYKAVHTKLRRTVAIKVLPAERTSNAHAVARFHREMEAVGKLNHPNIVQATDAGEQDGVHFLVMEFLTGTDLARLLERGRMPIAKACGIVRLAAQGLQHAHTHGLVHRDIKPSNVMVTSDGHVKVLDLGLARLNEQAPGQEQLTGEGQVMGTLDYIAPEQINSAGTVDIRADIYSLGCTLYHLLAGQPPFVDCSGFQKLVAHQMSPPPPLEKARPEVPPDLVAVVSRMMAKQAGDRFQTPAQVAEALKPFCRTASKEPTTTTAPPLKPQVKVIEVPKPVDLSSPAKSTSRGSGLWTLIVAVIVLIGGSFAYLKFSTSSNSAKIDTKPAVPRKDATLTEPPGDSATQTSAKAKGKGLPTGTKGGLSSKGGVKQENQSKSGTGTNGRGGGQKASPGGKGRPTSKGELTPPGGDPNALVMSMIGHTGAVGALVFAHSGKSLVSAGTDQTIHIWSVEQHKSVFEWPVSHTQHRSLITARNDQLILTGDLAGRLRFWDPRNGKQVGAEVKQGSEILGIAYRADVPMILAGSRDGVARLWDAATGQWKRELRNGKPVYGVALSPDGQTALVALGDKTVRVWDLENDRVEHSLDGHSEQVLSVAFSPDGNRAFSAGGTIPGYGRWDPTIRVWDWRSGKELHTWEVGDRSNPLNCTAFAPDGRRAITGFSDGTLSLWDLETGQCISRFVKHKGAVRCVAISDDGTLAASGGDDHTVCLWRLPAAGP